MVKYVLLDTNFIITCIKQKIDFFEEFYLAGIQVIIPEQVITELKKLKRDSALRLLEKSVFNVISLNGKNVDNAIVEFAKNNPDTIIATLDEGIRRKIKNKKISIRNKKKLDIL